MKTFSKALDILLVVLYSGFCVAHVMDWYEPSKTFISFVFGFVAYMFLLKALENEK